MMLGPDVIRQQVSPAPIGPRKSHPLDLPDDKIQCAHVEVSYDNDGTFLGYSKCHQVVYFGRHGYLCKFHHDLQYETISRSGYVPRVAPDIDELMVRMQREVKNCSNPTVDYSKYIQWGWSRQPREVHDAEEWDD